MRTVICHYHIYKNSGTSFDWLLSENFGEKHICFDGPFPFFTIDQEQLIRIIERKPDVIAFSSHQIQLPVPVSLDFHILPVLFLRHPLLRIYSIYKFKRQSLDGTETSVNAQKMTFNDWVSFCCNHRSEIVHVSNAQARIISAAYRQKPLIRRQEGTMIYDVRQAERNLKNVPLLARTEYFDEDVVRFEKILQSYNVEFRFKKSQPHNASSNNSKSPDERIHEVRSLLSDENVKRLSAINAQDFILYEYAGKLISHNDSGFF